YGRDETGYHSVSYVNGVGSLSEGRFVNTSRSVEVSAEGALMQVPAGAIRLAIGAGYRKNGLTVDRKQPASAVSNSFSSERDSRYAYGEVHVPVVSPRMDVSGIHRLTLTGAMRYEDYPGMASVSTPKLGLVYAPTSAVDLKASWGESFRTPVLYELFT